MLARWCLTITAMPMMLKLTVQSSKDPWMCWLVKKPVQNADACKAAMIKELNRWIKHGAWKRMPLSESRNLLKPKSVLKWKMIGGSKDVKGRLVAQGFQDRQSISIHKYFCRYHFEMGTENHHCTCYPVWMAVVQCRHFRSILAWYNLRSCPRKIPLNP